MNEDPKCSNESPSGGVPSPTAPSATTAGAGDGGSSLSTPEPSSSSDTSAPAAADASPSKIKYTSKIKRGMALARMIVMASLDDNMMSSASIIAKWTEKQRREFNDYLAWAEQEEDWESVADAWAKAGGK